jgi:hypothetical protein
MAEHRSNAPVFRLWGIANLLSDVMNPGRSRRSLRGVPGKGGDLLGMHGTQLRQGRFEPGIRLDGLIDLPPLIEQNRRQFGLFSALDPDPPQCQHGDRRQDNKGCRLPLGKQRHHRDCPMQSAYSSRRRLTNPAITCPPARVHSSKAAHAAS